MTPRGGPHRGPPLEPHPAASGRYPQRPPHPRRESPRHLRGVVQRDPHDPPCEHEEVSRQKPPGSRADPERRRSRRVVDQRGAEPPPAIQGSPRRPIPRHPQHRTTIRIHHEPRPALAVNANPPVSPREPERLQLCHGASTRPAVGAGTDRASAARSSPSRRSSPTPVPGPASGTVGTCPAGRRGRRCPVLRTWRCLEAPGVVRVQERTVSAGRSGRRGLRPSRWLSPTSAVPEWGDPPSSAVPDAERLRFGAPCGSPTTPHCSRQAPRKTVQHSRSPQPALPMLRDGHGARSATTTHPGTGPPVRARGGARGAGSAPRDTLRAPPA